MSHTASNPRRIQGGFTLIELLVVIAIIALLVSILLPSLSKAKELGRRMRCLAHLRGIGMAHAVYATEHEYIPGERGVAQKDVYDSPSGGFVGRDNYVSGTTKVNCPTASGCLAMTGCLPEDGKIWLCPDDLRTPGTYTYSYTINGRTGLKPGCDDSTSIADNISYEKAITNADKYRIDPRKFDTFKTPAEVLLLGEENTGRLSGYTINDPRFTWNDVTEPRHLGESATAYLDGHAAMIPEDISLWYDRDYWWD